jgi:hypothetical protein
MAAPLYFQREVEMVLALEKRALFESFRRPRKAEKRHRRHNEFEEVGVIRLEPEPLQPGIVLEMDICHNLRDDAISIALYAAIQPRPLRPFCRYDVHDSPHENPAWFPPPVIPPGVFHRHVYNERAIQEGDVEDWDACAEPLDLVLGGSPQSQKERLKHRFIADLRISFEDRDTRGQLFNFES